MIQGGTVGFPGFPVQTSFPTPRFQPGSGGRGPCPCGRMGDMNPTRETTLPPPVHSSRVVVVVGGGLAGLVAAETLQATGARPGEACRPRVILVEASARVGGVVETIRRDGWLIERSADNFLAARPEGLALVDRLGLSEELISVFEPARRAFVFRAGRTLPVPSGFRLLAPGSRAGIEATEILSAEGKSRVLAERDVSPRAPADRGDESLESFALRRLGREAFDRLVQPLVAGIWTADPARLSMAAACPEFLRMEREHGSLSAAEEARLSELGAAHRAEGARYGQFVTLASGMGTLAERLSERIEAAGIERQRASVTALDRLPSGRWRVSMVPEGGRGESIDADGVIIALPAPIGARIVGPADRALAADLAGIDYAGSAVVVLGYARHQVAHPLDAAGVVVPRIEGRRALAVSFSSSKFPGRAPEGHVLLRVFLGGALDPERNLLDDDQLVALAREELAAIVGAEGTPKIVELARWPAAMPQYHLGHLERLERMTARLDALPGLALAGAAYEGVGIPQVIASGQAAAERVLSALRSELANPV